jgi:alpha-L-rhamnosidase
MKTFHFLTAGIIFFLLTVACNQQKERDGLHPKNLLCENLVNPMGIDVKQPRLSWISESRQRSQVQTAYRILVASTFENLNSDKGEIWDSRKIKSSQSILVTCHGAELKTGIVYYWKVKVWDKSGKESEWSEPGRWSMGLLNPTDWKAKWIGLDR